MKLYQSLRKVIGLITITPCMKVSHDLYPSLVHDYILYFENFVAQKRVQNKGSGTKELIQFLGHAQNVTAVSYHPELPIILTGSEDGSLRIWHANTYRLENSLNYNMERVWCVQALKGSNSVAVGYDDGTILIKMGRDEPAVTMDANGKLIWARHTELCQERLKLRL